MQQGRHWWGSMMRRPGGVAAALGQCHYPSAGLLASLLSSPPAHHVNWPACVEPCAVIFAMTRFVMARVVLEEPPPACPG